VPSFLSYGGIRELIRHNSGMYVLRQKYRRSFHPRIRPGIRARVIHHFITRRIPRAIDGSIREQLSERSKVVVR